MEVLISGREVRHLCELAISKVVPRTNFFFEDLVQESLLKIFRVAPGGKNLSKVRLAIRQVAWCKATDHIKSQQRKSGKLLLYRSPLTMPIDPSKLSFKDVEEDLRFRAKSRMISSRVVDIFLTKLQVCMDWNESFMGVHRANQETAKRMGCDYSEVRSSMDSYSYRLLCLCRDQPDRGRKTNKMRWWEYLERG